jgi:hypothetical protein
MMEFRDGKIRVQKRNETSAGRKDSPAGTQVNSYSIVLVRNVSRAVRYNKVKSTKSF